MLDKRILSFLGALFLIVFILSIAGCGTFKGAINGFGEDWKVLRRWDQKFRDNWW